MHLDVIDYRNDNPVRPRGLRPFVPAKHPAPIFVPTGWFSADQAAMREWLDVHACAILSRESDPR
jgi:hypothetical protein